MESTSHLSLHGPRELDSNSTPLDAIPDLTPSSLAKSPTTQAMMSSESPQSDQLKCRSCARVLAIVSPDGLQPARAADGCVVCQQFQDLYSAMQAAAQALTSFRDRRDTYAPKIDAYVELKKTKLEFSNWLLDVEACTQDVEETKAESNTAAARSEQRGTKRARSSSQTSTISSSSASPRTPDAAPKRKRLIKFSDTVEFREDYRPSPCFARSDDAYSRGRYAAPEGEEHLDTSGLALSHLKFSGMKKVGSKWVDVWEEVNDPEKSKKKSKKKRADEQAKEAEQDGASWGTIEEPLADPRSQRLARRKNSKATQEHIAVRPKNSRGIGNIESMPSQLDTARQPAGTWSGVAAKEMADIQLTASHTTDDNRETATSNHRDHEVSIEENSPIPSGDQALALDPEAAFDLTSAHGSNAQENDIKAAVAESFNAEQTLAVRYQTVTASPHEQETTGRDTPSVGSLPGEAKSGVNDQILPDDAGSRHDGTSIAAERQVLDDAMHSLPREAVPQSQAES